MDEACHKIKSLRFAYFSSSGSHSSSASSLFSLSAFHSCLFASRSGSANSLFSFSLFSVFYSCCFAFCSSSINCYFSFLYFFAFSFPFSFFYFLFQPQLFSFFYFLTFSFPFWPCVFSYSLRTLFYQPSSLSIHIFSLNLPQQTCLFFSLRPHVTPYNSAIFNSLISAKRYTLLPQKDDLLEKNFISPVKISLKRLQKKVNKTNKKNSASNLQQKQEKRRMFICCLAIICIPMK